MKLLGYSLFVRANAALANRLITEAIDKEFQVQD
jgi:hypothetical protein